MDTLSSLFSKKSQSNSKFLQKRYEMVLKQVHLGQYCCVWEGIPVIPKEFLDLISYRTWYH